MKTEIKYDSRGLVPAVIQDAANGDADKSECHEMECRMVVRFRREIRDEASPCYPGKMRPCAFSR